MPSDASSEHKRTMVVAIGVLVLLVIIAMYYHSQGGDGSSKFTVSQVVHEITSLPDQTLSLYNKAVPAKMRLSAGAKRGKFVGAFGHTPELQHCLDFDSSTDRTTDFNRCTWV